MRYTNGRIVDGVKALKAELQTRKDIVLGRVKVVHAHSGVMEVAPPTTKKTKAAMTPSIEVQYEYWGAAQLAKFMSPVAFDFVPDTDVTETTCKAASAP